MKKLLFTVASLVAAFAIGWEFGKRWMPGFFYKFLPTHQSMERVLLIGEWTGAIAAFVIMAVYIVLAVDKYRIRDFLLGIVILVIAGGVLAVAAKIFMTGVYILVVVLLIVGWILYSWLSD